ncbi:MAG: hypothetical protein KJS97_16605 [Alphaproteobacteria bacterium]|nr:hypothetical protein [Alphaproteobacteria bacterium]
MKFVIGHAQADEALAREVAQATKEECLVFPVRDGAGDVVFGDHLIRIALWTPHMADAGQAFAMERFLVNGNLRRLAVIFPDAPPLTPGLNDAGQIILNWSDQFADDLAVTMRVFKSDKFGADKLEPLTRKKRR